MNIPAKVCWSSANACMMIFIADIDGWASFVDCNGGDTELKRQQLLTKLNALAALINEKEKYFNGGFALM